MGLTTGLAKAIAPHRPPPFSAESNPPSHLLLYCTVIGLACTSDSDPGGCQGSPLTLGMISLNFSPQLPLHGEDIQALGPLEDVWTLLSICFPTASYPYLMHGLPVAGQPQHPGSRFLP